MKTFVVPDAHGNHKLVRGLLEQEGLIDDEGERTVGEDVQIIQLGDLANCVAESINMDLRALQLVGPVFDFMLVGNHEHPYFDGPPFSGFFRDEDVKRSLWRLHDFGLIRVAHEVDGILLTHAGVAADIVLEEADEAKWAKMLNQAWSEDPRHPLFAMIGYRRGGSSRSGGILWSDWSEPRSKQVAQLHGHTVDATWRAHYASNGQRGFELFRPYALATPVRASAVCIDIGAGKGATAILGAWIEDGAVRIVEHKVP